MCIDRCAAFALCLNVTVCVRRFPPMLSVYFYVFTCGWYVCVRASDEQYRVVFIDGRHGARRHFLCLLIINQLVSSSLLLSSFSSLFVHFYVDLYRFLFSIFPLFLSFFCLFILSLISSLFPFFPPIPTSTVPLPLPLSCSISTIFFLSIFFPSHLLFLLSVSSTLLCSSLIFNLLHSLSSPPIYVFLPPLLCLFSSPYFRPSPSLQSVDPVWTTPPSSPLDPPCCQVVAKVLVVSASVAAASSEGAWDTTAATPPSPTPSTTWPSCRRPTSWPWNLRSAATAPWRGWVSRGGD